MPDTLPSVPLPAEIWVDIYDATGLLVGTPLIITVISSPSRVLGHIGAMAPAVDTDEVVPLQNNIPAVVTEGELGFWMKANQDSTVSIQEG